MGIRTTDTIMDSREHLDEAQADVEFWKSFDETVDASELVTSVSRYEGAVRDLLEPEDWSELL
jgi:hypothetical protein